MQINLKLAQDLRVCLLNFNLQLRNKTHLLFIVCRCRFPFAAKIKFVSHIYHKQQELE